MDAGVLEGSMSLSMAAVTETADMLLTRARQIGGLYEEGERSKKTNHPRQEMA